MRFVAALGGFAAGDVTLTAHESALHRPMGAMISALRDVGTPALAAWCVAGGTAVAWTGEVESVDVGVEGEPCADG